MVCIVGFGSDCISYLQMCSHVSPSGVYISDVVIEE